VGDNVGDVAGMGSDIFESYCGSMIASIAIASTMAVATTEAMGGRGAMMSLPLALASLGLICSIGGILIVKKNSEKSPEKALRMGTMGASVLFIALAFFLISFMGLSNGIWVAVLSGAIGGIVIGLATEYYTAGKPVEHIAKAGETGAATVMIAGLAIGMQSVAIPVLTICGIIWVASEFAGLYGVGIAAVGMLATVGITSVSPPSACSQRSASPWLSTLTARSPTTPAVSPKWRVSAKRPARSPIHSTSLAIPRLRSARVLLSVLIGLFIGGVIPFVIAAITMTAVGDAAFEMIKEIRRQFREIDGLLEGTAEPDTAQCVDIATTAALKKMIVPGVIAVSAPPLVGFVLGAEALGGMLSGALLGCVLMALMMANAGGAWDNAKKFVEKGNLGGKGTDTHAATVVGDTVGDPFKDTSGPSMNILINVMAIVSLVIAPLLT
jgi:K(+)-stimulated pyrophosphate-energized sodium pump